MFGAVPVPWTVSWTAEEGFFLACCPHSKREAICQGWAEGEGKPQFGKPHAQRQREAIARGLCDLCAKPLSARTKVSLSHARVQAHGAEGPAVLQVEPLLHRECARESMLHCPALKRDIAQGTLRVRQVFRWRVQFARMSSEYVETLTGQRREAVGHAKVELLSWKDRDEAWLVGAAA
jgi:hypothetical protein